MQALAEKSNSMDTIYIDESGYTGGDLLDANQLFQGASSIRIDESTAKKLVDEYFPTRQSPELKHNKFSRRRNYWQRLLEIQKVLLDEFMGFTYLCHKKYLLILMFLDSCVEPFFYRKGMDFYKDGQNYALGSLLYFTAPTFWGKDNFDDILFFYQRASKTKSDLNIQALIEKAKSLQGKELSENLIPLIVEDEDCIRSIKNEENNTDAALVVLLSLLSHIEKYLNAEYTVIHDNSKNLLTYNSFIRQFIDIREERVFQATANTQARFPVKLVGVKQVDSKLSYGVQLADLLVGGMIEHALSMNGIKEKNEYNQRVRELYGNANLLHLLPDLDFEDSKKYRSDNDSLEFIDFIGKKIS
ncbi:hypothetical protein DCC62_07590 [candidate division KSB1 bacterium]|nr:MAG: hypothetical protein DCC62_07590 [candidate division KSB1 bacterium]